MLYSLATGFIAYYLFLFVIGLFIKLGSLMATLMVFGILCIIGGYIARSSRFVRRLGYGLGGFCIALFFVSEFLLPALQGQKDLIVSVAVIAGIIVYGVTRRYTFRRFVNPRRDENGQMRRPDPPYGREWMRWLFAFVL